MNDELGAATLLADYFDEFDHLLPFVVVVDAEATFHCDRDCHCLAHG